MAKLPAVTVISPTVLAIYAAYEAANENWDSLGISVGEIGNDCDRALWYALHWCAQPESIDGQKLSIFRTGDMWEERLVADLAQVGVEVTGQQDRIRLVGGHVRGKIDGRGFGVIEAPATEHLFEFKSSNTKNFAIIKRQGVKKAKPLHYGQVQIGMHMFGLQRAGYLVVNKDNDEREFQRVEYDAEYCMRQLARAERIIRSDAPPTRIADDPESHLCMFCKAKDVCHAGAAPRVSCRSCLHSTAEFHGDAAWSCARWSKPLSFKEQKAGCPAHLFIPALIPGEQVDVDWDAETVSYRMADGTIWIDGGDRQEDAA